MERKYIAFISYRHAQLDSAAAKALHTLIEQFVIPKGLRKDGKRKFGFVFRDQEELPVSSDLSEDIRRGLDNSEHLIVICSPDTAKSPWVSREIEYFLAHHPRQKVFAVLAAGEPADVFPYALTHVEHTDGTVEEVEPLALDVRAENTSAMERKLRKEALRLYAAMLGCPYDDLAQRQQRRRRKIIAAALSAVLAVSLGFSGMLLVKNRQIDLKNEELELKNEELARQKAEVQLRESELLTQNAREAMAAGDYAGAIEYAVAALPKENDPRPYHAESESALMEALNIFGQRQDDHLILETVLQQMTAITAFRVSGDGNALVTMDDYGTLTCFDTQTGEVLWTNQIPSSYFTSVFDHDWDLLLCGEGSMVGYFGGTLASFDIPSGKILWQQNLMLEDDHLFLSPDGSRLMCLARTLDIATGEIGYELTLLSAETGELISSISLPKELPAAGYLSNTEIGAFSEDGTLFAGSVLQAGDGYCLSYYIADLTAGTVRILRTETLSQYWYEETVESLAFSGDDLLVVRRSPTGGLSGCLEIIDSNSGELLLRAEPEGEPKIGDFDTADPIGAIHTGTKTYLHRGKLLYCVNRETGETEWSSKFAAKLQSLQIVQGSFFAYTLENGDYALAWRNDLGLYNSGVYGAMANLGDLAQAELWNDGFIRAEVDGGTIKNITAAGEENRGFAAVIRPGDEGKILIKRTKLSQNLTETHTVAAAGDKESLYDPVVAMGENTLALGPFNAYQQSGGTESHRLAVFDRQSLTHLLDIPTGTVLSQKETIVLPEGRGYILDDGSGGISLFGADGSEKVLSERKTVTLSQRENVILQGAVFESASVRLEDSEEILTVRCGENHLQFWKNGEEAEAIPLPERVIWALHDGVQFNRIMELGGNGLVVLSVFENEDDLLSDWLAVYDTNSDCWTFLEDQGSGEFGRICVVGQKSPAFAVADPNGTVWVYGNLNGEITKTRLDLQIPLSSVEQMSFVCSDGVLMVKTSGKQLLFYDVSTGEILLQHQLDTSNLTMVTAFEDAANRRLYVADLAGNMNSENGLCIDTSTWTVLAQIKGMLCFDEESSTLYRYDNGSLIAAVIPGTGELIRIARDLLE